MSQRIDKPVVGKTYWTERGAEAIIGAVSDTGNANGLLVVRGGVRVCYEWSESVDGTWPLYATDPTKPEPIDLKRKWRFRNSPNDLIVNVTKREDFLVVEGINGCGTKFSFPVAADGTYKVNRNFDLVPDDDLPALDLSKPVKFDHFFQFTVWMG